MPKFSTPSSKPIAEKGYVVLVFHSLHSVYEHMPIYESIVYKTLAEATKEAKGEARLYGNQKYIVVKVAPNTRSKFLTTISQNLKGAVITESFKGR